MEAQGQEKRGVPSTSDGNPTSRGGRPTGHEGGQKGRGVPGSDSGNSTSRGGRKLPTKNTGRGVTEGNDADSLGSITDYGDGCVDC
jgi:hypothetical protein